METKPKTDAERQALRRQRRKEESDGMRNELVKIAIEAKTLAEAKKLALRGIHPIFRDVDDALNGPLD